MLAEIQCLGHYAKDMKTCIQEARPTPALELHYGGNKTMEILNRLHSIVDI